MGEWQKSAAVLCKITLQHAGPPRIWAGKRLQSWAIPRGRAHEGRYVLQACRRGKDGTPNTIKIPARFVVWRLLVESFAGSRPEGTPLFRFARLRRRLKSGSRYAEVTRVFQGEKARARTDVPSPTLHRDRTCGAGIPAGSSTDFQDQDVL